MSFIEGVGDEVVYLFVAIVVIFLMSLAWISTRVHELPHISVVVLDRPVFQALLRLLRNSRRNFLLHISIRPDGVTTAAVEGDSQSAAVVESLDQARIDDTNDTEDSSSAESEGSSTPPSTETQPQPSSDETQNLAEAEEDAARCSTNSSVPEEFSTIRNRRLNFLDRLQTTKQVETDANECECEANETAELLSHNDNSQKDEDRQQVADSTIPTSTAADTAGNSVPPEGNVCIKLKYLDERQRLVHANLDETIGDFKRKHFSEELANRMTVRFIFNGQELKHDPATLRSCGLQNESVLRCLLAAARQEPTPRNANETEVQVANVGALMLPMFAVILGLLWYCRFMYRNYFNAMSTLILVGMTMLFSMGVLSAFHRRPEHEHAT